MSCLSLVYVVQAVLQVIWDIMKAPCGSCPGTVGGRLSPRSPLQGPDSPGPLGREGGPDKNTAFISYKRDVPEGINLDQVE